MERKNHRWSIFERLGRRIASAGQRIVRKSRNASEEKRLTKIIAENQEEMNDLFWKLGQSYYMKHRQEETCDEQAFMDQLNDLLEQNIRHREQIRRLHQQTVCRICGARIREDSLFCGSCGAGLDEEEMPAAENSRTCPDCGQILLEEHLFCTCCGKKQE